jgi:LPXTG-motif cell wall-anchored protein
MTFAPRRRASRALAILVAAAALMAPLALAGTALASTSTITQSDCDSGTIKDKSGQAISKSRCEALIGKQVQLASTGFNVLPLVGGGALLLCGAAFFGLRRSSRPLRAL